MPSPAVKVSARAAYLANNELQQYESKRPQIKSKKKNKLLRKRREKKEKLKMKKSDMTTKRKMDKDSNCVLDSDIFLPNKKMKALTNNSSLKICPPVQKGNPINKMVLNINKDAKQQKLKRNKKSEQSKLLNGDLQSSEVDCSQVIKPLTPESVNAINKDDSRVDGQEAFQFVIHPTKTKDFFSKYWEKKPLLLKRDNSDYYKGVFSTTDLDKMLREQNVLFSKNLDITSYCNGERETHNPIGRALAPVVWDYYNNGCSVRLLNPQTFHRPVWRLLSALQEFIGSFCGANIYLTPPDTQGFAPHWDDIEAFIIQLEGKKHWRVYEPRKPTEQLPRESSSNLSQKEVSNPVLDVILEAGDLLYFPRGFIHQGNTVDGEHSLHITISSYQKTCWSDLLEKIIPEALSVAMTEDVEFRKGLPLNYLDYMGIVHSDNSSSARQAFLTQMKSLMNKLVDYAPVDGAADQMGKGFIHDSLPPVLTEDEIKCSVFGSSNKWSKKHKRVINRVELEPDTPVRLVRGNCIRIVMEDECVKVYHTLENSREYHQEDPQFLELAADHAPAVEALIHSYPNYLTIEKFPLANLEEKMGLATGLWEKGLLLTAQLLEDHYD